MGKKGREEMQDIILNQFERTIRNAERNPQPTQVEQYIEESKAKQAAWEAKRAGQPVKQVEPRISHYDPNSPLHQLRGLNNEDRKAKLAELKKAGLIK
jgi:ribosomal protein L29